ncbi:HIT domain-containing protein [Patescibacteria group bacterium]|nr:HIT domain-containing protein [Patescibacteria group bacterium]
MDCIFCKIRDGEIPKEFIYQDEDVMVFPDIRPIKPTHLLIIPKKHVTDFLELTDDRLANRLREVIQKMIRKYKLEDKGYKLNINGGGYQIIDHLHIHLLGPMGIDPNR